MLGTDSVFSVLAADDSDRRVASRRALALAHTRVDNQLGSFLRGSVTKEEFEARLAAVRNDLDAHVASACEETGHTQPEYITASLIDHYRVDRRWQPRHAAPAFDASMQQQPGVDQYGQPLPQQAEQAQPIDPAAMQQGMDPSMMQQPMMDPTQIMDPAQQQGVDPMQQQMPQQDPRMGSRTAAGGYQLPRNDAGYPVWPTDDQGWHDHFQNMDQEYDTPPNTPLHHDSRCPLCGQGASIQQQPMQQYQAANNPSDQVDTSPKHVSCPECGGDKKTAGDESCKRCGGKGSVSQWGGSVLDAIAHVTAGEPEPKMDKRKWTPETVGDPDPGSTMHPNRHKDPLAVIPMTNRDQDGHELTEIGEQTTETVKLPAAGDTDHGFYDGGQTGPHTKTFPKGNQASPVTRIGI